MLPIFKAVKANGAQTVSDLIDKHGPEILDTEGQLVEDGARVTPFLVAAHAGNVAEQFCINQTSILTLRCTMLRSLARLGLSISC